LIVSLAPMICPELRVPEMAKLKAALARADDLMNVRRLNRAMIDLPSHDAS